MPDIDTDEQHVAIENACLALLENPQFHVLLDELHKIRDAFEKRHLIGLEPDASPRLYQRNIGYVAGLDCLLQTPALLASGQLRKGRSTTRQVSRAPSIPPLDA